MSTTSENSLKNHFLISTPQLKGSTFGQSIIYICEHSSGGTMGLKINHALNSNLGEMFQQLDIPCDTSSEFDAPILDGGPVNVQQGFILHNSKQIWENSLNITDSIQVTTSKDILYSIASRQFKGDYLVVLGYSGWSPNQLEDELKENSWMTLPATEEIIFSPNKQQIWPHCVKQLGFDFSQLSATTGNA
ncbi:MAG: YqgE/AlgH family protein [Gammaproteobacteria bacterium]|nr:YqgE/AlgH family protein [Gammaproteobacteria bacterium]